MIRAEELCFRIGTFALQNLSIEVGAGQYFVLLGPPGSGKTIFLECLCGLKRIGSGKIYLDGRDVTHLEPRARDIGYVPQDYALFPHLSVERNIAFGLRARRYQPKDVAARVAQIADLLGIGHLMPRRVAGLSGGERQRVALARALVLRPKVLLLDEPVCALDEVTRQDICAQLLRIQRQLGLTTIHVSHNLEEAFSVADRAAILYQGVMQQVGCLGELLRKPNSEFVARFMRCENIYCGQAVGQSAQDSSTHVSLGDVRLQIPGRHRGKLKFMIRPEDVLVFSGCQRDGESENEFRASLVRWRDCGGYVRVELDGPFSLIAHLTHAAFAGLQAGRSSDVVARLPARSIHVLPEQPVLHF
jgi:ABC-type Fe3+/spermidine/putrescine transport system ATPase subunit